MACLARRPGRRAGGRWPARPRADRRHGARRSCTSTPCRSSSASTASGWCSLGVLPLLLGLAIAIVPLQVGAYRIAFPAPRRPVVLGLAARLGLMVVRLRRQRRARRRRLRGRRPVPRVARPGGRVAAARLPSASWPPPSRCARAGHDARPRAAPRLELDGDRRSMLLLSLPVLVGDLILLYADHHYGRLLFGGNLGIGRLPRAGR